MCYVTPLAEYNEEKAKLIDQRFLNKATIYRRICVETYMVFVFLSKIALKSSTQNLHNVRFLGIGSMKNSSLKHLSCFLCVF